MRDTPAMELRHLRYFVAVADHGSFSRAAEALLVAQPALSRQIRALERELGNDLFERTATGSVLTPGGEALLDHARQILTLQSATETIVSRGARPRERVSIGLPPGVPEDWVLALTGSLRADAPRRVLIEYVEAGTSEQLRRLEEGRLDIAIVHQVPAGGHAVHLLWREPLGLAVRPEHALASAARYAPSDLDRLAVLIHSRNHVPTQQDRVVASVAGAGAQPRWIFAEFAEHPLPSAEVSGADAALVGVTTARRHLPDWPWRRIDGLDLSFTTWVVWRAQTRSGAQEVGAAILRHAARDATDRDATDRA